MDTEDFYPACSKLSDDDDYMDCLNCTLPNSNMTYIYY